MLPALFLAFIPSAAAGGMAVSDHCDGSVFFNPEPGHSFADMVRWLWEMERVPWPDWVQDVPQPPPPERVYGTGFG